MKENPQPTSIAPPENLPKLGMIPVEVSLPNWPYQALNLILFAEGAAAFEELTLSGGINQIEGQRRTHGPTCSARHAFSRQSILFKPIASAQSREEMARIFSQVDLLLVPSLRDENAHHQQQHRAASLTLRAGFVEVAEARSDWAPDPNHPLPKFSPPRACPRHHLIGRLFEEGTLGRAGIALERASQSPTSVTHVLIRSGTCSAGRSPRSPAAFSAPPLLGSTTLSANNSNRIRNASITRRFPRLPAVRVSKGIPRPAQETNSSPQHVASCTNQNIARPARTAFMRPTLDNAPTFDHQNLLRRRIVESRCAITNVVRRASVAQPFLNQRFGFRIQARSSLIENKDARVGKDRTRNGNALLLSARKFHPRSPKTVCISSRTTPRFIHARDANSCHNFLFTSLRPRKRHVLANRPVKQKTFPATRRKLRAIGIKLHGRKVDAIHQHPPASRHVNAAINP